MKMMVMIGNVRKHNGGEIDLTEEYINEEQLKLQNENERLNQVIIDLHDDIRKYNRKIKMQDHIIDTQQDIINTLVELVSLINDKE